VLVVYEPRGGTSCAAGSSSASCPYSYRPELGHTLGIYVNTGAGLMGSMNGPLGLPSGPCGCRGLAADATVGDGRDRSLQPQERIPEDRESKTAARLPDGGSFGQA
jgi:hypothetical protein